MKGRLRFLLVAAALVIGLGGAAIYLRFARPTGSGPAGPEVSPAWFRSVWTNREVQLVGLGDSVTAGFGARKGYGYYDRLVHNPKDEFPGMAGISLQVVIPNLRSTNFAVHGTTSEEHLAKQLPKLSVADSNVLGLVVITTGGNDLIHNYGRTPPREGAMYGATWQQAKPWIENFERRLLAILTEIQARFPGGCHIFLANIYDPTDGIGDIERAGLPAWKDGMRIHEAYNKIIRDAAEVNPNIHLVDLHEAFLGHGIHCVEFWRNHYRRHDPHYWYHVNLEDPNERGYDAIRRLFLIEIAKVFAPDGTASVTRP